MIDRRKGVKKIALNEDIFSEEPRIDVKPLYDILHNCAESFKKYCILLAAVEIGIFDQLAAPQTISSLSRALGADFNLTGNICKSLEMLGFITKDNGFYKNAEISNLYLRTGSPWAQHNVFKNLQQNISKNIMRAEWRLFVETFFKMTWVTNMISSFLPPIPAERTRNLFPKYMKA
jgi:hypothetical protein